MQASATVKVNPELLARYRVLAVAKGTTVHALMRMALELYIADPESAFIELDHDVWRALRNRFGETYRPLLSRLLRFYLYDPNLNPH